MPFLPSDAFPVDYLPDGNVRPLARVVWTGTSTPPDTVVIEAGTVSDLGSIPKLLRGLLPHDGPAARAFLVHDVLCNAVNAYQDALDLRTDGETWRANHMIELIGHGLITSIPRRPEPPAFSAVDTDAVFRVILAELGVGPVRWIYWEGVRAGALASRARRAGFTRTLLPFSLLAIPTLLVIIPAAAGGLVSRLFLLVFDGAAWPWERRARRRRAHRTAAALHRALDGIQ